VLKQYPRARNFRPNKVPFDANYRVCVPSTVTKRYTKMATPAAGGLDLPGEIAFFGIF